MKAESFASAEPVSLREQIARAIYDVRPFTVAMMFSGRVAGHMQGVGAINRASAKKLERVVAVNFREGKKLGLREAAEALRGQAQ